MLTLVTGLPKSRQLEVNVRRQVQRLIMRPSHWSNLIGLVHALLDVQLQLIHPLERRRVYQLCPLLENKILGCNTYLYRARMCNSANILTSQ